MRSDIAPGGTFPDYELPDHTNSPRQLIEVQGDDPLILTLARRPYSPKATQTPLNQPAFSPKAPGGSTPHPPSPTPRGLSSSPPTRRCRQRSTRARRPESRAPAHRRMRAMQYRLGRCCTLRWETPPSRRPHLRPAARL